MAQGAFDLACLLTAAGAAAGAANVHLTKNAAPALLREFSLELRFDAAFTVPEGACTLLLTRPSRPNPQLQAMMRTTSAGVTVQATYIAAPSLQPVPPT